MLLLTVLFISSRVSYATTWDEPWQEEVVKKAEYFVLARITANDAQKGLKATIIRSLGGGRLAGPISITEFYDLHLCSRSGGEGPEFHLERVDSCYLFLQKRPNGTYAIATPTTGFAVMQGGKVAATYRHSYHQTLVPRGVYEPTMTAIFQHYHNQPYDAAYINQFIAKTLILPPTELNKAGMNIFFLQHVALETTYHLGLSAYCTAILPFLHDTTNFHAQISAVRALTACNTAESKQQLLNLLADKHINDFVKALAVKTLAVYHPKELKTSLEKLAKTASDNSNDFGGNIMDPRVCTSLPSVKEALTKLIAQL